MITSLKWCCIITCIYVGKCLEFLDTIFGGGIIWMFITEYFDVHAAESKVKLKLMTQDQPPPFLIKNIF